MDALVFEQQRMPRAVAMKFPTAYVGLALENPAGRAVQFREQGGMVFGSGLLQGLHQCLPDLFQIGERYVYRPGGKHQIDGRRACLCRGLVDMGACREGYRRDEGDQQQ